MFLGPHGSDLVLWLHILAASVWIGGQIALGILVPVLRGDRALLSAAAHRFQWGAWTAFVLLIITGMVNIHDAGITASGMTGTARGRTLTLKLCFVAVSGIAAGLHSLVVGPRVSTRSGRTLNGALGGISLLTAMVAALYGVVIAEA